MNSSPTWNERHRSVPTEGKDYDLKEARKKLRNLMQEPIVEIMGGLLPSESKKIHDRFLSVRWPMHKNHLAILSMFFISAFQNNRFNFSLFSPFQPTLPAVRPLYIYPIVFSHIDFYSSTDKRNVSKSYGIDQRLYPSSEVLFFSLRDCKLVNLLQKCHAFVTVSR